MHNLRIITTSCCLAVSSLLAASTLTLDTALRLAQENNPQIRQADARVAEVRGNLTNARAARLPSLDLRGGYQVVDDDLMVTGGDNESWNLDLQLSQNLYTGGAVSSSNRQVEALLAAAEADLQATIIGASLAVREASIRLLQQQLDVVRDRFEAGTVSRFELLRSEVALANGRPALIRARNSYELAVVALLRAIGLENADPEAIQLDGQLAYSDFSRDLDDSLRLARSSRPEFRATEARVRAAGSAVDAIRAGSLPSLQLVAGYGLQKDPRSSDRGETIDGWSLGLQGSWNLWDANATRGDRLAAEARVRQAEISMDDLELRVATEVRQAYLSLREARELVEASQRVVEQALEALSLAQDRFSVGAAIQLEVLEAEVALTEARTNEISALADFNLAVARLRAAIGQ
jgi:outer membrane protein TolC